MKRFLIGLLFLLIGLAIGGVGTWLYIQKPEVRSQKSEETEKAKKVLFYRHPMNPRVTSPAPQKDEMGMDYVPVYEEDSAETETPGAVRISPEKIQKIGVKSEGAKIRNLKRTIRTVGRIEHDESKVFVINTKVGGWIERLYANRTDLMVHPGEKLLEIYSPELVATQEEYLLAFKNMGKLKDNPYPEIKKGAESLLQAARQRLKYWDITEEQVKRLEEKGEITRTMAIYADVHGIVTEKMVNQGMKIEGGEMLFKIIDHSDVWVYGEVYEYELPFIKLGQKARIIPSYTPAEVYTAAISHIYTHFGSARHEAEGMMEESRTAKIRFDLPNPEHKLKLGMYVNVELAIDVAANALTVPDSAVIDTGERQVIFVDKGDGRFEPREVTVGALADGYYQVLSGIKAGEKVVTSANFLIDSESSFRAAISGMKGH
ncbi:MAG: efflux RND transporter periplasmic adaptor subunit [Deltaproteobacteria bacterium]|nr:efflux RND transporter periplasmic adaptor subunit [Deltaproteobacteria bacterium]